MSHENLFEWQIIASIIVRGGGTKYCSWERDTGTRAALEVAMILNPLYFSGV